MKSFLNRSTAGFTLIELLVVIAIIGILASAVLASLEDARLSAQYATAQQELKVISDALVLAGRPGDPLTVVTGSNCTYCPCSAFTDLRNVPDSHACVTNLRDMLTAVSEQSVLLDDIEPYVRDPWGSPYQIDENEGEVLSDGDPCRRDLISTAGRDGDWFSGDDLIILLPYRTANCPQ